MKSQSTRKKLFFATLVTTAFLVCLELGARGIEGLRAWRRGPDAVELAVRNRFHPLRYELVPGGRLPSNGPIAQINADGLRGSAADRLKRRTRVLCLGDSVTFGYAPDVTDETTYPSALGRLLDTSRFEVINGGMPGFGSIDCLNHWVYKLSELKPDFVIILAGWNDSLHSQPFVRKPPSSGPLAFLNGSAVIRLARELTGRVMGSRPVNLSWERSRLVKAPTPSDPLSDLEFARTERVLETLVRSCRDLSATPILLTYPTFTRTEWVKVESLSDEELRPALSYLVGGELSPRGWRRFASYTNARIRAVATRLEVPLIEGESINSPRLFSDLIHLTAEGCAELARLVAPLVMKQPLPSNPKQEVSPRRDAAKLQTTSEWLTPTIRINGKTSSTRSIGPNNDLSKLFNFFARYGPTSIRQKSV